MEPQQPIQPAYTPSPIQPSTSFFSPKQKRIMMLGAITVGLLLLVMALTAIFAGGPNPNAVSLAVVDARNSEILDFIDQFDSKLRSSSSNEYVARAKILIASDNNSIAEYLSSKYGTEPTEEQIASLNSQAIADNLDQATSQSNFDQTFIETVQYEIQTNKTLLEKLDMENMDPALEAIVSTAIANYDSLLE